MNEKLKKVRDKVEDTIVKTYNWTQKHPVLTAIGTTVLGSVVTGAIAYKVGESRGEMTGMEIHARALGEKIQKQSPGTIKFFVENNEWGPYAGPTEPHDLVTESGQRLDAITGAMMMNLDSGNGAYVFNNGDELDVAIIEEPDIAVSMMEDVAEMFAKD